MKLPDMPFTPVVWDQLPAEEHPGSMGTSHWRSFEAGHLRVRIVDYGPGFVADHWCDRGHVLYVIAGCLTIKMEDGREMSFPEGSGFCVSDYGDEAHQVRTDLGCRAFIVD